MVRPGGLGEYVCGPDEDGTDLARQLRRSQAGSG